MNDPNCYICVPGPGDDIRFISGKLSDDENRIYVEASGCPPFYRASDVHRLCLLPGTATQDEREKRLQQILEFMESQKWTEGAEF